MLDCDNAWVAGAVKLLKQSSNQTIKQSFFIFTFHFNLFSTLNHSAEALLNSLFQRTL